MNPPTIFVDLIEVQRLTFDEYVVRYPSRGLDASERYLRYKHNFQPWRWVARNAGNEEQMARSSERYFNRTDALDAIEQLFGSGTTVFKREAEHGNVVLRRALQEEQ